MKKIISIISPVAILMILPILLGCSKDETPSKPIIVMELSPKQLSNLQSFKAELKVLDKDWQIVGVEWYINNQLNSSLSGKVSTPPIRLTNNWPEGEYPIKAVVTCINGDSKEIVEVTETFEVVNANISTIVKMKGSDPYAEGNVIKVGDEFECEIVLDSDKTTYKVDLTKVSFSLDGKEVASITQPPFVYKRIFTKSEVGSHTFTYHYYVDGEIKLDGLFDYTLRIVE